jgi:nitrogen fixation NifU-like protein
MEANEIYKEVLLDHFKHPRNKGKLRTADLVQKGSNSLCGDDVEVGLFLQGEHLQQVRFRGRGCSVCLASSSIMTEVVSGMAMIEASRLCKDMQQWFGKDCNDQSEIMQGLEALAAVREHPARHRCVMLPWEALSDALVKLLV